MKTKTLLATLVATLIFSAGTISAQTPQQYTGGPGIVISGSENYNSLPKDAQNFVKKHFKNLSVVKCEKYFAKGKYEIELSDGIDIEFDSKGKVMEIDAPDGKCLPAVVVKDLIHGKAYKRLEKDGFATMVESIDFDRRGKAVEVEINMPEPDVYVFNIDGNFIALGD